MSNTRSMKHSLGYLSIPFLGLVLGMFMLRSCESKTRDPSGHEQLIHISNDQLELSIHPQGGALVGLRYGAHKVNPFSWDLPLEDMPEANQGGAPYRGHFICLNRWGAPTPGEMALGMPHNGEAANLSWTIINSEKQAASMELLTPRESFYIKREVRMAPDQPLIRIREQFRNDVGFARPVMLVQHATFGVPFLDTLCITNSNAGYGFLQKHSKPDPEGNAYLWPGSPDMDIRSANQEEGFVSTHVITDSLGWCTLASPVQGFLVGYLWDGRHFPWLHIWHGLQEDKLWARGIEFGNTGLGDNYSLGARYGITTLGKKHSSMLEPGEALECTYLLFVAPLPPEFTGVRDIHYSKGKLSIKLEAQKGESVFEMQIPRKLIKDFNIK